MIRITQIRITLTETMIRITQMRITLTEVMLRMLRMRITSLLFYFLFLNIFFLYKLLISKTRITKSHLKNAY